MVKAMSALVSFVLHVIVTSFKIFLMLGTQESSRGRKTGPCRRIINEEERTRSPN